MKHRHKFKKIYLNENQSLKYQIMLVLMEEHKRARLGIKPFIGNYTGDDFISFDNEDWKKISDIIKELISPNHKEFLFEIEDFMTMDEIVFSLIESQNYCYTFEYDKKMEVRIFKITPQGYSYQFNDYMKSSDKANYINNKIQNRIMFLTVVIVLYYFISWFKPELNLKEITSVINSIIAFGEALKEQILFVLINFNSILLELLKSFLGIIITIIILKSIKKALEKD